MLTLLRRWLAARKDAPPVEVLEFPVGNWPPVVVRRVSTQLGPVVVRRHEVALPEIVVWRSNTALPEVEVSENLVWLNHDADDIEVLGGVLEPLAEPVIWGADFGADTDEPRRSGRTGTDGVEPPDPEVVTRNDLCRLLFPLLLPPARTDFANEDLPFPAELYPYQRAGVRWLFERDAALLADDMGLGKTVQAITAFRALVRRGLALQCLVICPKAMLANWCHELERWAPELAAAEIAGSRRERTAAWKTPAPRGATSS